MSKKAPTKKATAKKKRVRNQLPIQEKLKILVHYRKSEIKNVAGYLNRYQNELKGLSHTWFYTFKKQYEDVSIEQLTELSSTTTANKEEARDNNYNNNKNVNKVPYTGASISLLDENR